MSEELRTTSMDGKTTCTKKYYGKNTYKNELISGIGGMLFGVLLLAISAIKGANSFIFGVIILIFGFVRIFKAKAYSRKRTSIPLLEVNNQQLVFSMPMIGFREIYIKDIEKIEIKKFIVSRRIKLFVEGEKVPIIFFHTFFDKSQRQEVLTLFEKIHNQILENYSKKVILGENLKSWDSLHKDKTIESILDNSAKKTEDITILLAENPNIKVNIMSRELELLQAASIGDLSKVMSCYSEELNLDIRYQGGYSALEYACKKGYTEIARFLADKKIELNGRTLGYTPLIFATENSHKEIVEILLKNNAYVNLPGKIDGWTAMITASSKGFIDIVKLLLEYSADVNCHAISGTTALCEAVYSGHVEIVKLLIEVGAVIDAPGDGGVTAIEEARRKGNSELINVLTPDKGAIKAIEEFRQFILEDNLLPIENLLNIDYAVQLAMDINASEYSWFNEFREMYDNNMIDASRKILDKVLSDDTGCALAWLWYGITFVEKYSEYDKSLQCFLTGAKQCNQGKTLLLRQAAEHLFFKLQDMPNAIKFFFNTILSVTSQTKAWGNHSEVGCITQERAIQFTKIFLVSYGFLDFNYFLEKSIRMISGLEDSYIDMIATIISKSTDFNETKKVIQEMFPSVQMKIEALLTSQLE